MVHTEAGSGAHPTPENCRVSRRSLLSAVSINAVAGTLFAWSVFTPALSTEFGLPVGELGVVFSGALGVFSLAVLFAGGVVDRYGSRRATVFAGALSASGLALAAMAPNLIFLFLGIGVLFGFGSGLTYVGAVAWANTWGGQRRAGVVGLVVAAYAAGPAIAGPVGAASTDRWGWSATIGVAAVIVAATMFLASRGLPGPLQSRRRETAAAAVTPVGDTIALVGLWLWFFGSVSPGLFAFAYAAQIATERGISSGTASLIVALMAVANLAGRLLAAPLSTRIGLVVALWGNGGILFLVLMALARPLWEPVIALALPALALQYGVVSALLPLATREVCPSDRFGSAYGRVFSSWGLAALAGPALGVTLGARDVGFTLGFQTLLGAAVLAFLALAIYQYRLTRAPLAE
jgi:MFS transporter, OFA family, oxalate/formate antiporter